MLEQPKLLRRPLPPKLLPPLPPSTSKQNNQNNHKEITSWVKQPIEKITSSEEIIEKERKIHILDYSPTFPAPEIKKSKPLGFSAFQHAPTPPVSIITPSVYDAQQKYSPISLKTHTSDHTEEKPLSETSRPTDSRDYDAHLLQLVDDVPAHHLSTQFSLEDLITKSSDHMYVKENLQKPLISRFNYNVLVRRLGNELQKSRQTKVNKVEITFDNIQEASIRFPWRQHLLEQRTKSLNISEGIRYTIYDGKKRKFETTDPKVNTIYIPEGGRFDVEKPTFEHEKRKWRHAGRKLKVTDLSQTNGTFITSDDSNYYPDEEEEDSPDEYGLHALEENYLQSLEENYFQPSSSTNVESKKTMELISPAEMALLKSLLHGGLTLSLKAYFLDKLPDLAPLYAHLIYLNLSFNDLAHFPKEVYNIENLQVLKLRNNPIKEIPPDIHRLRNLRTFIISFCLISALPSGLFFLQDLQFLDVSYNSIPFIPNEIRNLRALDYLNVEGNELPSLPCGALKLKLKQIRLGNNFMHPLLWKENSRNQPQKLSDLAAFYFSKNNLWRGYSEIPREAEKILNNFTECDCCQGPRYGQGIKIIRPCEKMFGICNLPFMFFCLLIILL